MQRNETNKINPDNNTGKILKRLGGPPAKKPVLGEKVTVYDGSEEMKVDKHGRYYIGISVDDVLQEPPCGPDDTIRNEEGIVTADVYNLKLK